MAIIRCPECRRKISDQAVACVYCGYPVGSIKKDDIVCKAEQNQKIMPRAGVTDKDNNKRWLTKAGGFNLPFLIIFAIGSLVYIIIYSLIFETIGWTYSLFGILLFPLLGLLSFYLIFRRLRERAWIATKISSPIFIFMGIVLVIGMNEALLFSDLFDKLLPALIAACECVSILVLIGNIKRMRNGDYEFIR